MKRKSTTCSISSSQHSITTTKECKMNLQEDELAELKQTFDLLVNDKSGTIDPLKLTYDLEDSNPIVHSMIETLKEYGKLIDFEKFIELILDRLGDNRSRAGVKHLFALYDTQGDGYIDFKKLKLVAKELGEDMNDDEVKEMIHNIHILSKTQKPDRINFEEFYQIIKYK